MSPILRNPVCLLNRSNIAGNINIIKILRRIQQANWSLTKGLKESFRLIATNARKDPDLPLRFVTTIRILLSKQNCVRLMGPDPNNYERNRAKITLRSDPGFQPCPASASLGANHLVLRNIQ